MITLNLDFIKDQHTELLNSYIEYLFFFQETFFVYFYLKTKHTYSMLHNPKTTQHKILSLRLFCGGQLNRY